MQSSNELHHELSSLVVRYNAAMLRDEPFEKVFPIRKAITQKKKDLDKSIQERATIVSR
ncbi:MAG TPA: hypothetical protein VD996_10035 [Chitinophagaceae bacterium]|nr:hypothetical protein [Chitinophagaceae bacterium]